MKITTGLICALLLEGLIAISFALAGDLKEPGLAFPADYPETGRQHLSAALKGKDSRYLWGRFVNSSTTLSYGGDTNALNHFLEGLSKCPGFTLSLRFDSDAAVWSGGGDWLLTHSALSPDQITVRINLKSGDLKLEELVIPPSKALSSSK